MDRDNSSLSYGASPSIWNHLPSVGKTQTENELNQTLKSWKPNEFKLKLNSPTL